MSLSYSLAFSCQPSTVCANYSLFALSVEMICSMIGNLEKWSLRNEIVLSFSRSQTPLRHLQALQLIMQGGSHDSYHLFCFSQSLISYLEIWKLNISLSGYDTDQFLNYQQWRLTWYSFLGLLDIDYASSFQCEECGSYPKVLLCDATTLGFRRQYARPIEIDRVEESQVTRLRGR